MQARIDNATGAVIEWGAVDFVAAPGQSIVPITDPGSFPEGVPNRYVRVTSGFFVAMTLAERHAVNLTIPQRRRQRVQHAGEVTVNTNESASGGGWGDVIGLTTAEPLLSGSYEILCGFELGLVDSSGLHTSQAQLRIDSVEVALWQNARSAYNRNQYVATHVYVTGSMPTFQLRIRRLGPGPGTARARRASIVIVPSPAIDTEL
jgi:hypothetical protein